MNEKQLLMCDFHDARIERLVLHSAGDCEIEFEVLLCYFAVPQNPEVADVWAARGTLSFQGCENLVFSDVLSNELWVVDAEFEYRDCDANDKYNLTLLNGKSLRNGRIVFNNGGTINVTGGSIKLDLAEFYESVERCDWP